MSANLSLLQTLFAQLQTRYPGGCVIAELLTIHQGCFVVRAQVQMAGAPLATGMAAAADIEVAEDRAKLRALEALGLTVPSPSAPTYPVYEAPALLEETPEATPALVTVPTPLQESPAFTSPASIEVSASLPDRVVSVPSQPAFPSEEETPLVDRSSAAASVPPVTAAPGLDSNLLGWDKPSSQQALASIKPEGAELPPDLETFSLTSASEALSAEPPAPPKNGKSTKKKTDAPKVLPPEEKAETPEPIERTIDRSEEIARIGVEMKRLGWNTEQGRTHLKQTYGKRSRQELDDAELLNFLSYLESQPSPTQSPF